MKCLTVPKLDTKTFVKNAPWYRRNRNLLKIQINRKDRKNGMSSSSPSVIKNELPNSVFESHRLIGEPNTKCKYKTHAKLGCLDRDRNTPYSIPLFSLYICSDMLWYVRVFVYYLFEEHRRRKTKKEAICLHLFQHTIRL